MDIGTCRINTVFLRCGLLRNIKPSMIMADFAQTSTPSLYTSRLYGSRLVPVPVLIQSGPCWTYVDGACSLSFHGWTLDTTVWELQFRCDGTGWVVDEWVRTLTWWRMPHLPLWCAIVEAGLTRRDFWAMLTLSWYPLYTWTWTLGLESFVFFNLPLILFK